MPISLKRVKIGKKLLWRAYKKSPMLFRFFLGHRHISTSGFSSTATETAVFALFFARTAQQSELDSTNGLSSSKPCVLSDCANL